MVLEESYCPDDNDKHTEAVLDADWQMALTCLCLPHTTCLNFTSCYIPNTVICNSGMVYEAVGHVAAEGCVTEVYMQERGKQQMSKWQSCVQQVSEQHTVLSCCHRSWCWIWKRLLGEMLCDVPVQAGVRNCQYWGFTLSISAMQGCCISLTWSVVDSVWPVPFQRPFVVSSWTLLTYTYMCWYTCTCRYMLA